MVEREDCIGNGVEYTVFKSQADTRRSIIFIAGMACNRFGHPVYQEPVGAVSDLVNLAEYKYDLIFPDVNEITELHGDDVIEAKTVEEQVDRLRAVLDAITTRVEQNETVFVAQSLGGLALSALCYPSAPRSDAILLGAPTYEGNAHKERLVEMFSSREKTSVDASGEGYVQFGKGDLLHVFPEYWESIYSNTIIKNIAGMRDNFRSITAISASEDKFYPNNKDYLEPLKEDIKRVEVAGQSHTFKTDAMRHDLKAIIGQLLKSYTP